MCIRTGQVKSPNLSTHNVHEFHCKELSNFMVKHGCRHRTVAMTVSTLPDVHQLGYITTTLVAKEDGRWVVKPVFNLMILGGPVGHTAFHILCKTSNHPWTADHLYLHVMIVENKQIISRIRPLSPAKFETHLLLWIFSSQGLKAS